MASVKCDPATDCDDRQCSYIPVQTWKYLTSLSNTAKPWEEDIRESNVEKAQQDIHCPVG